MLDFLGNSTSVLISIAVIFGFIALGILFALEIGMMATLWMKHAFRSGSGDDLVPGSYRRPRPLRK